MTIIRRQRHSKKWRLAIFTSSRNHASDAAHHSGSADVLGRYQSDSAQMRVWDDKVTMAQENPNMQMAGTHICDRSLLRYKLRTRAISRGPPEFMRGRDVFMRSMAGVTVWLLGRNTAGYVINCGPSLVGVSDRGLIMASPFSLGKFMVRVREGFC